jgi:hypothetical protein
MTMSQSWDLDRRREILSAYSAAMERLDGLLWAEDEGGVAGHAEIDRLQAQLSELWDAYAAAVPRLPVARCPFTGAVVVHSCDDAGLDGLWWQYESPVRPAESLPPTFWALTGAVSIASPPESVPFLCKPGPGVPYVLPNLLGARPVKAVLRSFPVGRHTAYSIAYFVALPGLGLPRPNTWGTDYYTWTNEAGGQRWGQVEEDEEFDFDLRPWLERGQLLWIAPDDAGLELHSGAAGCPYLDLEGERRPQYVQYGEVATW